jgi:hypothetical protein
MNYIGKRQESVLLFAVKHENGTDVPITALTEAFHVFVDRPQGMYATRGDINPAALFRTRRAVKRLIERGLMEEAGTAISESDPGGHRGRRLPKGYARDCQTYRLTQAGRAIAEKIDTDVKERMEATRLSPEKRASEANLEAARRLLD